MQERGFIYFTGRGWNEGEINGKLPNNQRDSQLPFTWYLFLLLKVHFWFISAGAWQTLWKISALQSRFSSPPQLHLLRFPTNLPQHDLFHFQLSGQEQQRAHQDLLLKREGIVGSLLAQSHSVTVNFWNDLGYMNKTNPLGNRWLGGWSTYRVNKSSSDF